MRETSTPAATAAAARCPLCRDELNPVPVLNALSRYDNETYICSTCGQMEGLAMPVAHDRLPAGARRTVLYFDEIIGIVKVTENEAGFRNLFPNPAEPSWARNYVDWVNERLDCDAQAALDIVAGSMAVQNDMERFLGRRGAMD